MNTKIAPGVLRLLSLRSCRGAPCRGVLDTSRAALDTLTFYDSRRIAVHSENDSPIRGGRSVSVGSRFYPASLPRIAASPSAEARESKNDGSLVSAIARERGRFGPFRGGIRARQ